MLRARMVTPSEEEIQTSDMPIEHSETKKLTDSAGENPLFRKPVLRYVQDDIANVVNRQKCNADEY